MKGWIRWMKNVQITQDLFLKLFRYFFFDSDECYEDIKQELERKLDSMALRELYTKSKTAPTPEEREEARQKYLDEKGILKSFRW